MDSILNLFNKRQSNEEMVQQPSSCSNCQMLEQQLNESKFDYENMLARYERRLAEQRRAINLKLNKAMAEEWGMLGQMVDLVIEGKRDPKHLKTLWQDVDHVLREKGVIL